MAAQPTILHADLDAFYASVEQRDDPHLRGRPVIVGAGVVLSASYEARAFGVYTPMGVSKAMWLCPDAIVVRPRFAAYSDASKSVFEIFEHTTPLVEGLSIDEAFLDVHGLERLSGTPTEIAVKLRLDVREQVGLPITVGVARTKHLAKVASGVAKPDGLLVVPPDDELVFLHALEVEHLWGVGPVTARKLHQRGITRVGQLAALDEEGLVSILGRAAGRHLHALAHNQDPRPVHVGRRRHSIGSQHATGLHRLPSDPEELDATIVGLVDRVTRRVRAARRVGRTVVLRMRFGDYSRATRSQTLVMATAETQTILRAIRSLVVTAMPLIQRQGLTMVGITVSNLENDDAVQLPLPFERRPPRAVDLVVDQVRERFGTQALTRASQLGRDDDFGVPLLPEPLVGR
ncbi:MAG: DNA polymerase IV [Chloroflexi bacterium]|nr:DNA polymerase IV [Chloroflexota bacterium]